MPAQAGTWCGGGRAGVAWEAVAHGRGLEASGLSPRSARAGFLAAVRFTVRRAKSSLTRSFPCGVNAPVASVAAAQGWLRGGWLCSPVPVALFPGSRNPVSLLCSAGGGGVTAPFVISQAFLFVLLCFSRPADRVCSLKVCALPTSCSLGRQAGARASPRSAERAL